MPPARKPRPRKGSRVPSDLPDWFKESARRLELHFSDDFDHDPTTNTVRLIEPEISYFRLTGAGTSGAYPALEIRPTASGGFADGTRTATVYEVNAYSGLPLVRVIARRDRDGKWRFQGNNC
jgi:hypothetical protein